MLILEEELFAGGEDEFPSAINAYQHPVNEFHAPGLREKSGTEANSGADGIHEWSIDPILWFDPWARRACAFYHAYFSIVLSGFIAFCARCHKSRKSAVNADRHL